LEQVEPPSLVAWTSVRALSSAKKPRRIAVSPHRKYTGSNADIRPPARHDVCSGDFQCALFAVKGRYLRSGDLLAPATDRLNRGRMHAAQLRAPCLDYPEYSTLRHFKLRGMLVTLGFTDPRWRSGKLIGFTLTLSATPDESAASPTPEHVAGPEPPASCYP
jgi:hypothetical protein